jgi:hypothetical protein
MATQPFDIGFSPCRMKMMPKTEQEDGDLKWPVNGRGDEAKLDRLENPESR